MTKLFINFTPGAFQGTSHSHRVIQAWILQRTEHSWGTFCFLSFFCASFIKFILNHKRPATTASGERTTNVIMCKLSHTGWMESSSQPEKGHARDWETRARISYYQKDMMSSGSTRRKHEEEATQPLYKQMKRWHQKSQSLEVKITNVMQGRDVLLIMHC